MKTSPAQKWWQSAVFYQIYPRSFADGNGDGIGDLAGMRSRLDYLKDLGIDAIWLSPHYPSPMCDCGYDVSDYTGVAPEYGTLEEFKRFLEEAHQRGIRVILDLVLNHTADQHPWFMESRSSLDNPKRDWYIWKQGRNGHPPNDWSSTFGGPAWEYDPLTGEYYYHFFFKGQPDLNWHNPQVREAMWDVVRFWFRLGVDGFRLDAVGTIFEDERWQDNKLAYTVDDIYAFSKTAHTPAEQHQVHRKWMKLFEQQVDQPEVHPLMKELRRVVDEFDGRVLVGETEDITFYGSGDDELHLSFDFPLMHTRLITPAWVRTNQKTRLATLPTGAWPCNTLGNHDSSRMISSFGDGLHDRQLAEVNLAMLLYIKGTPFLYNGEEIGMTDFLVSDIKQIRDPLSNHIYNLEIKSGTDPQEAALIAARHGRDICRTPLQWKNAPNGGFCPEGVTPWLPVNPNYASGVNVEQQLADPGSLLHAYRRLLAVRKQNPALQAGEYQPLLTGSRSILAFTRTVSGQACLVAINYTLKSRTIHLPELNRVSRVILASKTGEKPPASGKLVLQPYEVWVGELSGA